MTITDLLKYCLFHSSSDLPTHGGVLLRTFKSGTQFESPFLGTSLKIKLNTTINSQQLTYSHRASPKVH